VADQFEPPAWSSSSSVRRIPLGHGKLFAGYTIVRLLGSGGMGQVYLAQHPRLPRRDALKLLPHDWSADAEYRARFMREADLASTLWHPHIVGVHDRGEETGQLWISMDFVDGLDAARLLADRYPGGIPVEDVARIVTAVAAALDYAHKQGLLHRDVKPANIMVTHVDDEGEQRILLTDFGIARDVNDISGITQTNMTVGTVAYSAPEQLLGEHMDGRADQYSLAATAFHLLTGSHLFPDSNPVVVATRHVNVPPPALADRRPELADLDPILAIGLAKRPEDRFARCSDFARAFSEQVSPAGAPTQAATTKPAPRAKATAASAEPVSDARRRWWLGVAALVVCLLSIAALVAVLVRHEHAPTPSVDHRQVSRPSSSSAVAAPPSSAAAPLPPAAAAPTTTTPRRYAIPACYSIEDPPVERPTSVVFEYCGDGGAQLDHMTWTTWGPNVADGQGYFSVKSCQPNCAEGGMAHFPAEIHATNPVALQKNSGCPTDMLFYTDLTLAFPTSSPDGLNGQTINSRYDGYPAIQFSTNPDQPNVARITPSDCW
jgi:serine/threonine protein kinase, bacterial